MTDGGEFVAEVDQVEATGESPKPRRRPQIVFGIVAVLALVSGIAAIAFGNDGRAPAEDLHRTLAFAAANKTARYALIAEFEFAAGEEGLGQASSSRSREDGVISLPHSSAGTWRDGVSTGQTVILPVGEYSRWVDGDDDLEAEQWVFVSAEDLAEQEREWEDASSEDAEMMASSILGGMSSGFGAGAVAGDALGALGAPDQFIDALRDLSELERVDEDTIRGTLELADLVPKTIAAELTNQVEVAITVDITMAGGGRLDEVVLRQDLKVVGDEMLDMFGDAPRTITSTLTVRFSDWGEPVEITAPSASDVDRTPGVDEEDLAAFDSFPLLTVAELPAKWKLTSTYHEEEDEDIEWCEEVSLTYSDPDAEPTDGPDGEEVWPPDLTVTVTDVGCEWQVEAEGDPIKVGGRDAVVAEETYEDEAPYTTVTMRVDGVRVDVSSDLPRDEVLARAANLAPFDLATQPIHVEDALPTS